MISSRRAARDSLLFVYGTLRPGVPIPMSRWLRRVASYLGPATTTGRLYDLGHYPGLVVAQRAREVVAGDLYRVRSSETLRVLDRYEQGTNARLPVFVRALARIRLGNHRRGYAWLYVYDRRVLPRARIESGDYRIFLSAPK